jgi:diguanylate cyclase (GGDEF)-like protein
MDARMQPLQQTDRPPYGPSQRETPNDVSGEGRALGLALGLRAEECCDLCYSRATAYRWAGRPPDPNYTERSRGVNWLATVLTARWIAYGVPVSADEMQYIAERGDLAASLQQSTVNITRAYLIWRDTIGEVLRDEAARLQTPRDTLNNALRVVRISCDASLVQVAGAFDRRMTELNSELANERETLSYQALHDPLTGLPNRVLLYDRISQAMLVSKRTTRPFAILAIDLDGFKAVNDTLGHDGGDVVLQQVADRLVKSVRESDTVARQGGDEFTVLLSRMAAETAADVARKLEDRLCQVLAYDGKTVSVGATIGVATFPRDGDDLHILLRSADHAMYRRKREKESQTR